MAYDSLANLLLRMGQVDPDSLQRAISEQKRWGGDLGRHLVELQIITEETLVRAYSTLYNLPAVALEPPRMYPAVAKLISRELCQKHSLVCFHADLKRNTLDVAVADPSDLSAIDEVRIQTQRKVRTHIAARSAINKAIEFTFYGSVSAFGDEIELSTGLTPTDRNQPRAVDLSLQTGPGLGRDHDIREFASAELKIVPSMPESKPVRPVSERPGAVELEVQVRESRSVSSPRPVPPIDDLPLDLLSESDLAQRLTQLEGAVLRNRAIVERLLQELLRKKVFSQEEVMRILGTSR